MLLMLFLRIPLHAAHGIVGYGVDTVGAASNSGNVPCPFHAASQSVGPTCCTTGANASSFIVMLYPNLVSLGRCLLPRQFP